MFSFTVYINLYVSVVSLLLPTAKILKYIFVPKGKFGIAVFETHVLSTVFVIEIIFPKVAKLSDHST